MMKTNQIESKPEELISTNDPLNDIQFSDIFNLEDIQRLQDLFADASGIASIITHVDGTPITNPSNFCRLCTDIIRKTEKGCANCLKSDAALGIQSSSGPVIHQCLSVGLWEAGARITVGGKHIANWIIGQVRNEELDIQQMIKYADEIGVNREEFLDALNEVPVMSVEQFSKLSKMLFLVANEYSEKAYNSWLLKMQIAEREKATVLLKESEAKFQILFNKAPFGYQSLDIDGNFIEVNHQWLDTLGYTSEEVIGKWFGDFLSPAYQEGFRKRFPIFKAEGKIHSEFEMVHKNGNLIFVAFDGKIGYDLNGKFKQTHCILQDITEHKQMEKVLHQLNRTRQMLSDTNQALVHSTDEATLLNEVCRITVDVGDYRMGWIAFIEHDEEKTMRPVAQAGFDSGYIESAKVSWADNERGQGPSGTAIRTGQPSISHNISLDPAYAPWREEAIKRGYNSNIALPIIIENQAIGALNIYSAEIDAFDDKEVEILKELVGELAFGINALRTREKRDQAEELLCESEKSLRDAQHLAHIGSWKWTKATDMVKCSEELYPIIGRDPHSSISGLAEIFSHFALDSWKRLNAALLKVMESGEPDELELELVQPDGTTRYTLARGEADYDATGKIVGLQGIVQDITERKRAETEIQRKNEELVKINAEKDRFFSIIAHDLKSPFTGFLGLTEIMAEGMSGMNLDEIKELAHVMRTSAINIFRLLGNLLEWSRMQRGLTTFNPSSFLLMPVISETLVLALDAANKKEIAIIYNVPEDLEVFADANMFGIIIRNLVTNAVKFTPQGGSITVSAKPVSYKSVEISIKDTGIGMNADMIDNLFRLDKNTGRKGTEGEFSTGLGLILCKDFTEKHGGQLWVESEEGKGSVFYFTLPYIRKTEETNEIKNFDFDEKVMRRINPEVSGLKILIAEDDEASEVIISKAVQKFAKEIIIVKTGIDAVEVCCDNPDIDLVLMDIKMPEMDGYEAIRQIRLFNPYVVIIAQTAFALTFDRENAISAGCNDYVAKPFSKSLLISLIEKYFKLNYKK